MSEYAASMNLTKEFERTRLPRNHPPAMLAFDEDDITFIWPCGQTSTLPKNHATRIRWYHRAIFRVQRIYARLLGRTIGKLTPYRTTCKACRWLGQDALWAMALSLHAWMQTAERNPEPYRLLSLYASVLNQDIVNRPAFYPVPAAGPYVIARITQRARYVGGYGDSIYVTNTDPSVYGPELIKQLIDHA